MLPPPPPITQMTFLIAASLAVIAALYASSRAALATFAVLSLVSIVFMIATYQEDSLSKLVADNERSVCNSNGCAVNRCAIQTMDNPFANPGPAQFGTSNVFAGQCPLSKAEALMKARDRSGGVQYADGRAFYQVPSIDTADMRQWLYAMPENCKHNQRACRPDATILDKVRLDPALGEGSFVDYM